MIRVSQDRASIFMAIGFAMLGTFLDLFGSALTYIGGLPEQTSPFSAIPITSMTLINLMMPVRVDPNARPAWWCATVSRKVAVLVPSACPSWRGYTRYVTRQG